MSISQTFPGVPNREISRVEWFSWGDVVQLLDESSASYNFWGSTYSAELLNWWATGLGNRSSLIDTLRHMHSTKTFYSVKWGTYQDSWHLEKNK